MPRSSARRTDALLSADRLGFAFPDGRMLFRDLTLGFGRERTGLVGANGIGKSTLVRLLLGELAPTSGEIVRRARIGYLPQRRIVDATDDDERRTVADAFGAGDVLAALARTLAGAPADGDFERIGDRWDLRERIDAELARFALAHVSVDRTLASLSGGERTRVALAALVIDRPDLLILDEPTNDLDAESRDTLYAMTESWTGGLIAISHDRELLRRVDRIVELTSRGAREYGGAFDLFESQRDAEDAAARRELDHARLALKRAKRDVQEAHERQERRVARGKRLGVTRGLSKLELSGMRASGERTASRLGGVGERLIEEGRERLATAKERVEERERLAFDLASTGLHATKMMVEACDLTFAYASAPLIAGLTFEVRGPERVAIVGRNGAGKTTLLRLIAGELSPTAGTLRVGVERVAYLDQHAASLDPNRSVLDNALAADPALEAGAARQLLATFLFRGDAALATVASLSGGERLRAALACTIGAGAPPQLLLLDEPTNHLDLDSLRAVEDALLAYDGALIVVSHDTTFLDRIGIARRIVLG